MKTHLMTDNKKELVQDRTLFRHLNFFMLRTPLLPIERYGELFEFVGLEAEEQRQVAATRLAKMAQDPVVRESVAVASRSLIQSLPILEDVEAGRKREQVQRGILRYLLRMMTRPTPFGLFSGVAYGTIGEQTKLRLGQAHQKRSRPDMEWLLKMVQQLESRTDLVRQLRVQTNPLAYEDGSRVQLAHVARHGLKKDERVRASVRFTEVVKLVFQAAATWIPYEELVDVVQSSYPGTPREKISHLLWQLFEQEFLISELRPPLLISSPAAHVRNVLMNVQGADEEAKLLEEVLDRLKAYDQMPIGEGERLFTETVDRMLGYAEVKDPVQVDVRLDAKEAILSQDVAQEAACAAEVMWRLAPKLLGSQHLQEYRKRFWEKYGYRREVPLLELIDENRGLGIPLGYLDDEAMEKPLYDKKREQALLQIVSRLMQNRETELVLTDELVAELEPVAADPVRAPLSLELYVTVASQSREAIDQGEYLLFVGANPGSNAAGQTFGRFADMLGEPFLQQMKLVHEKEQRLRPDAIFADVVMLPDGGRNMNVALSPSLRSHEIAMGTPSFSDAVTTLPLSDLVVGVMGRHGQEMFYLRSRSLGRQIIPMNAHMLNPQASSFAIYRFLCDMSLEQTRPWWCWDWGQLENLPYLPRVRYGRTVLSPMTWKINNRLLPVTADANGAAFAELLRRWREEWNVPRYVFRTVADHRILLDLEHPLHQAELQREIAALKKDGSFTVTESGMEPVHGVVEGEDGTYWNEFVIPLVRDTHPMPVLSTRVDTTQISDEERLKLPGSDWVYAKLYGTRGREEELVGWQLEAFCRAMEEEGIVERSFFIRFADPEHHLRVRFHGEPEKLTAELLPRLHAWVKQQKRDGLVSYLVLDTYDREIERYGGEALLPLAEQLFAADSRTTGAWLGWHRAGQLPMSLDTLAVISVIDMLQDIAPTREEQLAFLEDFAVRNRYQQIFRELRKELTEFTLAYDEKIVTGFEGRRNAMRAYVEAVKAHDAQTLTNDYRTIMLSVIHMHLNRLLRPTPEHEQKIVSLAYLTLNVWKHIGK